MSWANRFRKCDRCQKRGSKELVCAMTIGGYRRFVISVCPSCSIKVAKETKDLGDEIDQTISYSKRLRIEGIVDRAWEGTMTSQSRDKIFEYGRSTQAEKAIDRAWEKNH